MKWKDQLYSTTMLCFFITSGLLFIRSFTSFLPFSSAWKVLQRWSI